MDIRFSCPACEHHLVIDETGAGLVIQCPKCGADAKVPDAYRPEVVFDPEKERTVALKWTPPGVSQPAQQPK